MDRPMKQWRVLRGPSHRGCLYCTEGSGFCRLSARLFGDLIHSSSTFSSLFKFHTTWLSSVLTGQRMRTVSMSSWGGLPRRDFRLPPPSAEQGNVEDALLAIAEWKESQRDLESGPKKLGGRPEV